MSLPTTDISRL